ncbi:hypothetical protein [Dongshaea marina]|uniref:hypothetical protein n=1 Tax=Dongshaea marina TaxID=2047966 RepID=UPI000D3E11A2|nr:hypothetical protein [Dongshaea marina]
MNNEERSQKMFWVRQFRKAKTLKTLHLMVSRALDRYSLQSRVLAAIFLAECQRERELSSGLLLNH